MKTEKHVFSKSILRSIQTMRNKVVKFNEDLEAYYKVSGDRELPIIDCTIYGFEPFEPYDIRDFENGFSITDGIEIEVKAVFEYDEYEEEWLERIQGWDDGYDSLKESLSYDRRRLNKAWRIWKSENPDAELEKVDED